LLDALAPCIGADDTEKLESLAVHIAENSDAGVERQLFLDVSELCQHDAATGVQRVVRSYLHQLLKAPPAGFRVEPVYATINEGYRYARTFVASCLGAPSYSLEDPPLRWQRGDLFFALDMQHHVQLSHAPFYSYLRQHGVVVKFMVYDLLPVQLEEFFRDQNIKELHERWLRMIAAQDGASCISKATADAYNDWMRTNSIRKAPGFHIDWVHLGADLEGSNPSTGLPDDAIEILDALR